MRRVKWHAQEGEGRIGNRVDEVFDEVPAFRAELEVLAAEGHDARRPLLAERLGDAVGVQAGAVDDQAGAHLALAGQNAQAIAFAA